MSDEITPPNSPQPPPRRVNIEVNTAPYPIPTMPVLPVEPDDGRPSKALSLEEAIARYVPDGVESLAIGGLHMHNNPMGLVRELVRQQKHIRRLITGPGACLNADLLIGAGLVEEIVTSYIGFEYLGAAPAFQRLRQAGRLKVQEVDELSLLLALEAGASGQPFAAVSPLLSLTSLPAATPDFYKTVTNPFTGKPQGQAQLVIPALRPKVALVVCQQADKHGNAVFKGSPFADRELIMAAETVVLQVEQLVTTRQLTRTPIAVSVPGYRVAAVVEASFSCHPSACHRFYNYDEAHIQEYLQLAATGAGFDEYLQKYVLGQNETEYLGKTAVANG